MQRTSYAAWASLCKALRASANVRSVYNRLVALYSSPPRAYHNLSQYETAARENLRRSIAAIDRGRSPSRRTKEKK
jgi:predicted metal-dependent HD superfamily phosphohydrolase